MTTTVTSRENKRREIVIGSNLPADLGKREIEQFLHSIEMCIIRLYVIN